MFRNLLALTALLFSFQTLATETWKVASLEWKPYTWESLPEGGIGIVNLREALKAEGVELDVKFYPWTRAMLREIIHRKLFNAVFPSLWKIAESGKKRANMDESFNMLTELKNSTVIKVPSIENIDE